MSHRGKTIKNRTESQMRLERPHGHPALPDDLGSGTLRWMPDGPNILPQRTLSPMWMEKLLMAGWSPHPQWTWTRIPA